MLLSLMLESVTLHAPKTNPPSSRLPSCWLPVATSKCRFCLWKKNVFMFVDQETIHMKDRTRSTCGSNLPWGFKHFRCTPRKRKAVGSATHENIRITSLSSYLYAKSFISFAKRHVTLSRLARPHYAPHRKQLCEAASHRQLFNYLVGVHANMHGSGPQSLQVVCPCHAPLRLLYKQQENTVASVSGGMRLLQERALN